MMSGARQTNRQNILTRAHSLNLVRNSIRTAISSIAYLRNLFDEEVFEDRMVAGLPLKILRPYSNPEARLLLAWLDEGVLDALENQYLRLLLFAIHDMDDNLIECYHFGFSYDSKSMAVRIGSESAGVKQTSIRTNSIPLGATNEKSVAREQTIKLLQNLIMVTQDLSPLPEYRYLSMKIWYYDGKVPRTYEPKHFRSPLPTETLLKFSGIPINVELGDVTTVYHGVELKLKTGLEARRLIQHPTFRRAQQHPFAVTASRIGRAKLPDLQPCAPVPSTMQIAGEKNSPPVPLQAPVAVSEELVRAETSNGSIPPSISTHQFKLQQKASSGSNSGLERPKSWRPDDDAPNDKSRHSLKQRALKFVDQKTVLKLKEFQNFAGVDVTQAREVIDELIASGFLEKYSTKARGFPAVQGVS